MTGQVLLAHTACAERGLGSQWPRVAAQPLFVHHKGWVPGQGRGVWPPGVTSAGQCRLGVRARGGIEFLCCQSVLLGKVGDEGIHPSLGGRDGGDEEEHIKSGFKTGNTDTRA